MEPSLKCLTTAPLLLMVRDSSFERPGSLRSPLFPLPRSGKLCLTITPQSRGTGWTLDKSPCESRFGSGALSDGLSYLDRSNCQLTQSKTLVLQFCSPLLASIKFKYIMLNIFWKNYFIIKFVSMVKKINSILQFWRYYRTFAKIKKNE